MDEHVMADGTVVPVGPGQPVPASGGTGGADPVAALDQQIAAFRDDPSRRLPWTDEELAAFQDLWRRRVVVAEGVASAADQMGGRDLVVDEQGIHEADPESGPPGLAPWARVPGAVELARQAPAHLSTQVVSLLNNVAEAHWHDRAEPPAVAEAGHRAHWQEQYEGKQRAVAHVLKYLTSDERAALMGPRANGWGRLIDVPRIWDEVAEVGERLLGWTPGEPWDERYEASVRAEFSDTE